MPKISCWHSFRWAIAFLLSGLGAACPLIKELGPLLGRSLLHHCKTHSTLSRLLENTVVYSFHYFEHWTFKFYYERSLLAWLLSFFVPVSMYTKMLIYNTENTKHWKNRKIICPLPFHALKMTFEKNKVHLFLRHERKIKNQSFTFKAAMLNSIKIINSVNLCFEL